MNHQVELGASRQQQILNLRSFKPWSRASSLSQLCWNLLYPQEVDTVSLDDCYNEFLGRTDACPGETSGKS